MQYIVFPCQTINKYKFTVGRIKIGVQSILVECQNCRIWLFEANVTALAIDFFTETNI